MAFKRRWKGFTAKQVSERMTAITKNRFRNEEEKRAHVAAMVAARGAWKVIDGKKIFMRAKKEKAV